MNQLRAPFRFQNIKYIKHAIVSQIENSEQINRNDNTKEHKTQVQQNIINIVII